jgi:hypothetical protein
MALFHRIKPQLFIVILLHNYDQNEIT